VLLAGDAHAGLAISEKSQESRTRFFQYLDIDLVRACAEGEKGFRHRFIDGLALTLYLFLHACFTLPCGAVV
jgi:hypothetical protein